MANLYEILQKDKVESGEQLKRYILDKNDRKLQTLHWWRQNYWQYPRIAVIERKMLEREEICVPPERLFNIGGHLIVYTVTLTFLICYPFSSYTYNLRMVRTQDFLY